MEMTNKELDEYVNVREGAFIGAMYKINKADFIDDNGKSLLQLDYDVLNLEEGKEKEFEQWLGEFVIRALEYAVENDPNDGNAI